MKTPPRVMPALVTPFDVDGEIDDAAHRHNLTVLFDRGVQGFLIAGSTGEGPYLEAGERLRLLRTAREVLGPEPVLLCGVAAETRRAADAQLDEAAAGGADAAVVMTPTTLVRGNDQAVAAHYLALADAPALPIMIYSVPSYTAYEPPVAVVADLATHPNVVGMKDSGGDPVRLGRIAAGAPDSFFLFCGSSVALQSGMASGTFGAITASANYVPELVIRVISAALRDGDEARKLQTELTGIIDVVEPHRIPGIKAAAAATGLKPGSVRAPLSPLGEGIVGTISRTIGSI